MKNYFKDISTKEAANALWKELAKKYHSDHTGGDDKIMSIINQQYKKLLDQLENPVVKEYIYIERKNTSAHVGIIDKTPFKIQISEETKEQLVQTAIEAGKSIGGALLEGLANKFMKKHTS